VPSATLATVELAPHRDHESLSATVGKRSRDVGQSRVHRPAGYSIVANHWPYRCNAIGGALASENRAKDTEEVPLEFDRSLDLQITLAISPFPDARAKVIVEPRAKLK